MEAQQKLAVLLIGLAVPLAYIAFVVFLTWRGRAFSRMEDLFDGIARLQADLHAAFTARGDTRK